MHLLNISSSLSEKALNPPDVVWIWDQIQECCYGAQDADAWMLTRLQLTHLEGVQARALCRTLTHFTHHVFMEPLHAGTGLGIHMAVMVRGAHTSGRIYF